MKKLVLGLLCMLLLAFCMVTVYADEPPHPPTPWHIDLGNGLAFHYRPEYAHYSPHEFYWGTPTEFEAQGYPRTGLYRDGELVYTVEKPLSRHSRLYFSNDSMSFFEVAWWVFIYTEPLDPAVRFFHQGNLIHTYQISDLVSNRRRLVYTVSHVMWDYQQERHHDRENNTLHVRTRDGRNLTFDLSTGLVSPNRRIFNNPIFWGEAVVVILAGIPAVVKVCKKFIFSSPSSDKVDTFS